MSKNKHSEDLLDKPLIKFSHNPMDWWTVRNAVTGTQIFGGIGSGKSSGSGQTIAYSFLNQKFGGIILTGKMDETEVWLKYAKETGRLDDVIIFGTDREVRDDDEFAHLRNKGYRFNPLLYMSKDKKMGETDNLVSLFFSLIKVGERSEGGSSSSSDRFWDRALKRIMRVSIDLLKFADKGWNLWENEPSPFALSVPNISMVIREASMDRYGGSNKDFEDIYRAWMKESYTGKAFFYAEKFVAQSQNKSIEQAFAVAEHYFNLDFQEMPENTRGSIKETFYSFANPFSSGLLADYFASEQMNQIDPEWTFGDETENGKIIILDFPVKEFLEVGIYAQVIFKKLWQQKVEKRVVGKQTKPVFMWVDEAQFFLSEDDMTFQTTARSSRACTVMISQNISNYYATIGGQHPVERVNSLLGNLSTKIFHANNDYVTNEWAANTIGQVFQKKTSITSSGGASFSISPALHYQVEPQAFTLLKNGGKLNNSIVEAIMTVSGKEWSSGKNFISTSFYQNKEDFTD